MNERLDLSVPCICDAGIDPDKGGVHSTACARNAYELGIEASKKMRDLVAETGKDVETLLVESERDDLVDLLRELQ